jgi:hypothetical protein
METNTHRTEPEPTLVVGKRRGYTVIPNGVIPEGRISARAWGLYVYLLSRPPGWECRPSQLKTVFKEGRDALYTTLHELVELGLVVKETYRRDGMPRTRFVLPDPNPDSQDSENPAVCADSPNPDSQVTEKPEGDTTDKPITTEVRQQPLVDESTVADPFDEFWAAYPRKVGKPAALKAYRAASKRLRSRNVPADQFLLAAARSLATDPNLPPATFIPHPTTWLNRDGWDDGPLPSRTGREELHKAATGYSRDEESRAVSVDEWRAGA